MTNTLSMLLATLCLLGEDDLRVLPAREVKTVQEGMVYRHLYNLAAAAIERRRQAYERIKTPEQARAWQAARRDYFRRQLGGLPEPCPLDAKVVGALAGDGYRVEKVIYQSRPQHHVTALLYLPLGKAPHPGVIVPCGHSYDGKADEGYQRVGILLARNGIAALCCDPIGQGERYQVLNKDGSLLPNPDPNPYSKSRLDPIVGRPQFNPVEEHNLVGIGSILLGLNTASYRIYDGMRSIDYLVSRPEIDPKRIGCTGNSGGGTLTSYIMALDDRVACAAPACFLTTFQRLLEKPGPQDAEQNIFGQLAFGMDEADYVLMRAPKPTCILAGTRDSLFDIAGAWEIFREGKRLFARFGLPERMSMVEADEPHGFTMPLRIGAARWMRRWLLGADDPVVERECPVWTDQQVQCTPQGQVLFMPGEQSVFDLNRQVNESLALKRRRLWQGARGPAAIETVRELIGARRLAELPEPKLRQTGAIQRSGYRIEKLVLESEPGIELPALAFVPSQPGPDAYLYADGRGKHADAACGGAIEALVRQGHLVLAVDLRGMGETDPRGRQSSYRFRDQEYSLAYLLGRSLVAVRTEDVLVAARFLAGYRAQGAPRTVRVIGIGAAGIPALHAAALEPELIASLRLRRTLASWSEVLETSVPEDQLDSTVHGALRVYDLPDLVRAVGPAKVVVEEPADARGGRFLSASDRPRDLKALRAARRQAAHRKRRMIFNNDGDDVIYTRKAPTPDALLALRTAPLVGSQVDSIFYSNSLCFGDALHASRVMSPFLSTEYIFKDNGLPQLLQRAIDPIRVMVDFGRKQGIEVFWDMRMNDTHDAGLSGYGPYLLPKLKRCHPEYLVGAPDRQPKYGSWSSVNYARPEIREIAFRFFEEVCQKFDVDGVELDFLRHACFFKSVAEGGRASREELDAMTGLVRRIRQMTEREGLRRGRPILVAIRVPDSVEFCRGIGLDLEKWLAEGLVDILSGTCYFQCNPWEYLIGLGHRYGVPVYPCLSESRVSGETRFQRNSIESYRARAMRAWAAGADGIYLFNYFDPLGAVWHDLGDAQALQTKDKLYFVTVRNGDPERYLSGGRACRHVPILTPSDPWPVPAQKPCEADLAVGDDVASAQQAGLDPRVTCHVRATGRDLEVCLNGHRLQNPSAKGEWLDFPVPPALLRKDANRLAFRAPPQDRSAASPDQRISVKIPSSAVSLMDVAVSIQYKKRDAFTCRASPPSPVAR